MYIYLDILQLIVFYFYPHYFHIQYVTPKITYSYWFVIVSSRCLKIHQPKYYQDNKKKQQKILSRKSLSKKEKEKK